MITILQIAIWFVAIITISVIIIIAGYYVSKSNVISLDMINSITIPGIDMNKKETYRDKYYSTLTSNIDDMLNTLLDAVEYRKIKKEVYPILDKLNDSSPKYNKMKTQVENEFGTLPEFTDIDIVREILIFDAIITTIDNNKHELFNIHGIKKKKNKIFKTIFLNSDMFIKRLISRKYSDKKRNKYISIMERFII